MGIDGIVACFGGFGARFIQRLSRLLAIRSLYDFKELLVVGLKLARCPVRE